jgi:hypothetical protein
MEPARAAASLAERIDAAFKPVDCSDQPDTKARVIAGWTGLRANYLADEAGDCEAAHQLWQQACEAGLQRSCRRARLAAEGRCDER